MLGMVFVDGLVVLYQFGWDYVLILEDVLQFVGGEFWFQVMDELWEMIYVDYQSLFVVDVLEVIELVVDELFGLFFFFSELFLLVVECFDLLIVVIDYCSCDVFVSLFEQDGECVDDFF